MGLQAIAFVAAGWVGLSGVAVALCAAAKAGDQNMQRRATPVPVPAQRRDERDRLRRAA